MIGLIGGSVARAVGGSLVKGAAKGAVAKAVSGGGKKGMGPKGSKKNENQNSAIIVTPKTALIPASSISSRQFGSTSDRASTAAPNPTATGGDTLQKINSEVIEIKKLLGKSVKEEKTDVSNKKKLLEKQRREQKENKLEKGKKIGTSSGGLSKLVPGGGIVDAIKKFIFSVIGGKILIFLLENRETVFNIVKGLAAATEFLIDLGGKVLNGIISLVDGAYNITDAIGKEIEAVGGEDAAKSYSNFLGHFNKFINLAMILAMAGTPGNLKDLLQGGKPGAKPGVQPQSNLSPGGKPGPGSNKFGVGNDRSAEVMNRNRQAKLFERKYGNNAAREFSNAHNNAINSGMNPKDALADAKKRTERLIRKNKGRFKVQSAGPGLRGGPGGQAASGRMGGIFRRGLRNSGSRLQTRIMGRDARLGLNRSGARLASKVARIGSGPLGRLPIIGPLMVGIASYMEDGKLDRALFKVGGSALGGFLGSFIPIPFLGTLIGTLAGEYVGDLMYELIRGGGASAVGNRLKKDILKIVDGAKLFSEWMLKGITNIQKQDGPELDLSWVPFSNLGKIRLGGWATLLNPLEMNLLKKFDVLRKAFFSESDKMGEGSTTYVKTQNGSDKRGNSDAEGEESRSGGGAKPTVTPGGGRRSIPAGSGSITKVPFGDPNFSPGTSRNKTTQIYLHWTGGNYNDASKRYGYHTIFTGDGSIHRNKDYDVTGGHTEGKNSNSVGLSLAAMAGATGVNNFGSQPVTHEQLNAMTAEAARLAIEWGWDESQIDNNVWTHAEAGSGLDPRGLGPHQDWDGDGRPDNYGMFNRRPGESMHRWDLYTVTKGAEGGSGGSIARDMIKKHFRNFKQEEKEGNKRGNSDAEGPEAAAPSGSGDRKIPNSSGLEKWLNNTERGSGEKYNLKGVGNYVRGTMFGGAPYDKLFLYPGAKEFKDKNGQVKGASKIRSYLERNYPKLVSDKIMDEKGKTKKGTGLPGNQSGSLQERKAALDAQDAKRKKDKERKERENKEESNNNSNNSNNSNKSSSTYSDVDLSSLSGSGAFTDMFAGARSALAKPSNQVQPTTSRGVIAPTISSTSLNKDASLRQRAPYEETGSTTIVAYQPLIMDQGPNIEQQNSSGRLTYT